MLSGLYPRFMVEVHSGLKGQKADAVISQEDLRRRVAEKMAGEITLSVNPGETLKKWRTNFEIAQVDLATQLGVSPSVISDYESGRRKSPGIFIVSKIVDAILDIDVKRGCHKIRAFQGMVEEGRVQKDVIFDIYEYLSPMSLDELTETIKGEVLYRNGDSDKPIYGYTIVDSIRAILELSYNEFQKLYGWSSERAMIFTRVSTGRSPMVAIRVTNFKPGAVVIHGMKGSDVDPIAVKIAEIEHIPLLATTAPLEDISRDLRIRPNYNPPSSS